MENVTITTPVSKQTVVIRPFQPAKLENQLKRLFIEGQFIDMNKFVDAQKKAQDGTDVSTADITSGSNEVPATVLMDAERVTLEAMVISVGEVRENVYEELENMHPEDYKAVLEAVNKVTGGLGEKKA